MPHAREQSRIPSLRWLLLYLVCFVGSSIVVQLDPDAKPPWVDGSPIEYFTGSLLWSSSILSLIISGTRSAARRVTWLAISAGLAVLAIDEMFLLHEHLANIVGDDDHYKLVQWITTGFALWYLRKMENAPAETNWSFLIGYLIHTVYVAERFCGHPPRPDNQRRNGRRNPESYCQLAAVGCNALVQHRRADQGTQELLEILTSAVSVHGYVPLL